MPQYRLFGDTVDVAGMMTITGEGEVDRDKDKYKDHHWRWWQRQRSQPNSNVFVRWFLTGIGFKRSLPYSLVLKVSKQQLYTIINLATALKIHISLETKILLDINGSFVTEHRGAIEIKVRNNQRTKWSQNRGIFWIKTRRMSGLVCKTQQFNDVLCCFFTNKI